MRHWKIALPAALLAVYTFASSAIAANYEDRYFNRPTERIHV
jgi:hypothetical protein